MRAFVSRSVGRVRKWLAEFGRLTPIALVTTFLPILGSFLLLIIGYPIGIWLRENQIVGAVGYAGGVLIVCGLALMPTNVIGIIGGFAFGFGLGLTLLMSAIVGASLLSYLVHRRLVGDKLPELAEQHPRAQAVYDALTGQGFVRTTLVVLLIRLSVLMPFALSNFIFASAKVPRKSFAIGTFLGMLPRSGAVVLTGAGLSELTLSASENTAMIVFGIAATLISVIVISIVSRRALEKIAKAETS